MKPSMKWISLHVAGSPGLLGAFHNTPAAFPKNPAAHTHTPHDYICCVSCVGVDKQRILLCAHYCIIQYAKCSMQYSVCSNTFAAMQIRSSARCMR